MSAARCRFLRQPNPKHSNLIVSINFLVLLHVVLMSSADVLSPPLIGFFADVVLETLDRR